ncbi:hypothetical protein NDU88_006281 [Pleurodeles waltl]|uniref:Uncharacterized protein n=1 Tax=Pleurodeles waltl TaxID=8319 RepID=A0AAV7UMB5_PLEWA|nr:hypothetical protein NDU88_006281 [Pleurodeles waltl]
MQEVGYNWDTTGGKALLFYNVLKRGLPTEIQVHLDGVVGTEAKPWPEIQAHNIYYSKCKQEEDKERMEQAETATAKLVQKKLKKPSTEGALVTAPSATVTTPVQGQVPGGQRLIRSRFEALDLRIAPSREGPPQSVRFAAERGTGEAAARLPLLNFLPRAGGLWGFVRPPDVELRACMPSGARYSAAWVLVAGGLVLTRYGIGEESEAKGFAPVGGPGHLWGWSSLAAQRGCLAGDCGRSAGDRPGGLRCGPEAEGWCS